MTWFVVLHEWQAAQDLSTDNTWYPSADIYPTEKGARSSIDLMRNGEHPRRGQVTYRNVRGPFLWEEPQS